MKVFIYLKSALEFYGLTHTLVPSEGQEYEKLILAAKEGITTVHADAAVHQAGTGSKKGKARSARPLTQPDVTFIHLGIQISRDQYVVRHTCA